MDYTIKKGKHYSGFSLPKIYLSPKKIVKKITFSEECRYDLKNSDQYDINKLFGIGYLPWHQYNSIRFGWRYDNVSGKMEILAYWYKDKVRQFESMAFIDINKQYFYSIEITKDSHILSISDPSYSNDLKPIVASKSIALSSRKFGYFLKPFFGGNLTAPHTMTIKMI